VVGQRLTANPGRWSPRAVSYTYQWQRSTRGGSGWVKIAGATASIYTARSADVRARLRVVVTARNSSGLTTAASAATRTVQRRKPPHANSRSRRSLTR
jgi:hypothetical protein